MMVALVRSKAARKRVGKRSGVCTDEQREVEKMKG